MAIDRRLYFASFHSCSPLSSFADGKNSSFDVGRMSIVKLDNFCNQAHPIRCSPFMSIADGQNSFFHVRRLFMYDDPQMDEWPLASTLTDFAAFQVQKNRLGT